MAETEAFSEAVDERPAGDGLLTQDVLDALLAAANEEEAGSPLGASGEIPDLPGDSLADAPSFAPPTGHGAFGNGLGVGAIDLPSFDPPGSNGVYANGPEPAGMTRVRDIPLEVTVELGRTRLLIRDILDLSAGSIIELDKIAGEPVDLFANGLLVARGEVIVIDDNFGVRVTEIITAVDREQSGKESHAVAA